jgi:hypothetical protein
MVVSIWLTMIYANSTKVQLLHSKTPFCSRVYGVVLCCKILRVSQNLLKSFDAYSPPLFDLNVFTFHPI